MLVAPAMDRKRITNLFLLLAVFALLAGCVGKQSKVSTAVSWNAEQLLIAARDSARTALSASERGESKNAALRGADFAQRCIDLETNEAGCYYWHAVNTGLYYKLHIIGYQRGVKRMIEDCKKVIELDPKYDEAGAYRILGQLYTQLPQTGGQVESVTRDLSLAEKYLREAVKLAPNYPENFLSLTETLYAEEKIPEAIQNLARAQELSSQWIHDCSYGDWQVSMLNLGKKIKKITK